MVQLSNNKVAGAHSYTLVTREIRAQARVSRQLQQAGGKSLAG